MQTPKIYTVEQAKRKLEAYCAYQERSHQEVVTKLKQMQMIPMAIDAIVCHLIAHHFLNETRFAKSFARGKFRVKKWGKNRIKQELKQRNISDFLIKTAFKEISDQEYIATFEALADKKIAQLTDDCLQKRRKKLANYLLYRGWESHLVYQKCQEIQSL